MSERHSQGVHQDMHHWAIENEGVQRLGLAGTSGSQEGSGPCSEDLRNTTAVHCRERHIKKYKP